MALSAEGIALSSRGQREKRPRLRGDAIINRRDQLNRNGIRAIACAGSIISRTDVQGAREFFNARIGVSIIAISFIRLFLFYIGAPRRTLFLSRNSPAFSRAAFDDHGSRARVRRVQSALLRRELGFIDQVYIHLEIISVIPSRYGGLHEKYSFACRAREMRFVARKSHLEDRERPMVKSKRLTMHDTKVRAIRIR